MADQFFEAYKKRVYDKLSETDKKIIPVAWWDSEIGRASCRERV